MISKLQWNLLRATMALMIAAFGAASSAQAFFPALLLRGLASREAAAIGAEARLAPSAARAVARSEATAVGAARTEAAAARAAGKPADVLVSRQRYPEAAKHIEHAQRHGQPSILTIDRTGAAARRQESLRYINNRARRPGPNFDRDEYPPAMFREGGNTSNVRYIGQHDNRGAGKSVQQQLRGVPDGERARILTVD